MVATKSQRIRTGLIILLALAGQSCANSRRSTGDYRLEFDVHPCFGEVHLSLDSVKILDAQNQEATGLSLAAPPAVLLRDGQSERELGEFQPGCSGGLRVHVTLSETQTASPSIVLRGKLSDGSPVTGTRQIDAVEYR